MASLLLPLLLLGWALVCLWAAHRLGHWCSQRSGPVGWGHALRLELKALALVVLLPMPVIDELLAKPQFDALCRERLAVSVQAGVSQGQRVHHRVLPAEPLPGLLVPVSQHKHLYIDDDTHQTVLSYSSFEAHAGKLARLAGLSQAPLTFEGRCAPVSPYAVLAQAGVRAQRPGPLPEAVAGPDPSSP